MGRVSRCHNRPRRHHEHFRCHYPRRASRVLRLAAATEVASVADWVRNQQEQLREAEVRGPEVWIKTSREDLANARKRLPAMRRCCNRRPARRPKSLATRRARVRVRHIGEGLIERLHDLKQHGAYDAGAPDMLPLAKQLTWALEQAVRLRAVEGVDA